MIAASVAALVLFTATGLLVRLRRRRAASRPAGDRFEACLGLVLEAEGGFVEAPGDPGGATKFGITAATLSAWRDRPCAGPEVRALTRVEAAAIYRARYWDVLRCGALTPGLDLMVFDCAVNSGPKRSALILQQALEVVADGVIGPVTLGAAARCNKRDTIDALAASRLAICRRLPTFAAFGRGWERRIERMRRAALGMAGA
jgi:lysozyme family protein